MFLIKRACLIIMVVFYLVAGINHFRNPVSYYKIMPHFLPYPVILNILTGMLEVLFGLMLIYPKTKPLGAWGIIVLLIAFIPVHTKMIGDAPLHLGSFTVTPLIAWIRLLILQPLLIAWAWWYTKV